MHRQRVRIARFERSPLSVPLVDPFVIASTRIDVTRPVLISLLPHDAVTGQPAVGIGEAAALPGVTAEDQPDLLRQLDGAAGALHETRLTVADDLRPVAEWLASILPDARVARAGVEIAFLDALARLRGIPVRVLLGAAAGRSTRTLTTDITI